MIKELDEFNFHQQMEASTGIALVFFTGPHCASCHHLRDLLLANKVFLNNALGEFVYFICPVCFFTTRGSCIVKRIRKDY